ncbi:hypothetical protein MTR_3g107330 [Medicago truncatula]|uniref:ESF1 RRM domain-containing protein n=1 Tax=Medicago truncatula TaxID=3880 RepID=G7JB27_MEDTR|nr:hypothetical protein MTR_3g107330 [Medicago truncatula]
MEEHVKGVENESNSTTDEDTDAGTVMSKIRNEHEEVSVIEKDTHRLAVVYMDWNYVKVCMFYHAVVECDSSTTAAHIYKECNGLEFLSSPFDLRFIPDIWEFKQEPMDVVTKVPTNYVVKDFGPRALQHSKVDFDWEDDDPFRKRTLSRKFTDEQVSTALAYGKHLMDNIKNGVKYSIVIHYINCGNPSLHHHDIRSWFLKTIGNAETRKYMVWEI